MPGRLTAPGPGRSPTLSIGTLKVGGMQKMLTRVDACGAPPVVIAPAATPVMLMERAWVLPKAPAAMIWPCWQLVKRPCAAQSAFDLHPTAGFSNSNRVESRQKPQKTPD